LHIVDTAQLSLREMRNSDAGFYLEMLSDPDFKANIGDRGVHTEQDALTHMHDRVYASYEAHGFGMYLVTRKSDGEAIGMAGLVKREFLNYVDVGYAFLPRGRGQGFATEAAAACVELARERFDLKRLAAITDPGNGVSIRVLEKLGFVSAGQVKYPDDGEMCAYFLLDL
jgi:RimJ/RimL family protein N-acetyltransferase